MIEFVVVPEAPKPVAPYSHATAADGWVFVTGQVPTDPDDDGAPLPDGIEGQTHRVIENLKRVLAGVGSRLDQVVFARVYLTHFERDYAAMNTVYQSYFVPGRHWSRARRARRDRSAGTTGVEQDGLPSHVVRRG